MSICSSALYAYMAVDIHRATGLTLEDLKRSPLGFPGASYEQFASLRLAHSLLKKFQDEECADAEEKALKLFKQCNNRCADWELRLENSWDEVLWGEFKRSLYDFFHDSWNDLNWSVIFSLGRTGPGSALGSKSTDMYSKLFSGDLVSTNLLLNRIYESETALDQTWYLADSCRATHFSHKVVHGSRLAFVPKSREIKRSICTEPGLNMYFQLGLGGYLQSKLAKLARIELESQPDYNRELARLGSIDGSYGTIDLSSASDSISKRLLDEVLPTSIRYYLDVLRSPSTTYKGERIELHMISSMGNGYTFPLQTIIFFCMVQACYRARGVRLVRNTGGRPGNFGVFGDDIIVVKETYDDVIRLLTLAGFTPNHEKSFNDGFFRESCGHEYLSGRHVRGVYIKSMRTLQDRYVAINRLVEWSSMTGVRLYDTIRYLLRFVNPSMKVPFQSGYDSGLRVPLRLVEHRHRVKRYQSLGYYAWVPETRFVTFDDDNYPDRLGAKLSMIRNPNGLLCIMLAGHLRDGRIAIRQNAVRYRRRLRVVPNWDYPGSMTGLSGQFGWKQWETTASAILDV